MSILFTGSPEQRTLVTTTAEVVYKEVGQKQNCLETIHKSRHCVDISRSLATKLKEQDIPAVQVGTFDEFGFGFGEVPLYFHRFINLGNGWLADADWQLYLEKGSKLNDFKTFLANYRIYGTLAPKVLIAQISDFDDQLIKMGVHHRNIPSWENKTVEVDTPGQYRL